MQTDVKNLLYDKYELFSEVCLEKGENTKYK